jgi:hypothetical protein
MSIEQTDQLIRLILNSLLLVVACVAVVHGLLMRQAAFANRLRIAQQEYLELLDGTRPFKNDRLMQLKGQLRQLRQRYRIAHASLLTAHYALLVCMTSTVVIAFRMLFSPNWLIHTALILFVLGAAILLCSIGLTLVDVYATNRSLSEEIHWVLSLGMMEASFGSVLPQRKRSPLRHRTARRLNRTAN